MRRVEEHQSRGLIGEQLGETAGVGAAERVADQDERRGDIGGPQQAPQLAGHICGRPRQGDGFAPAGATSIVEHRSGELRDRLVNVQVIESDQAGARQKDHRRTTGAGAMEKCARAALHLRNTTLAPAGRSAVGEVGMVAS